MIWALEHERGFGREAIIAALSEPDEHGQTPLTYAVNGGHASTITLLLNEGVDVNAVDPVCMPIASQRLLTPYYHNQDQHRTYLHLATYAESEKAIKCLLDAGADPTVPDADGHLPLHLCIANKTAKPCAMLLKSAKDP